MAIVTCTPRACAARTRELVETLRDDLLHVRREKYWEVNERRMNLDYVPDEQRETLRRILDTLDGTPGAAVPRADPKAVTPTAPARVDPLSRPEPRG